MQATRCDRCGRFYLKGDNELRLKPDGIAYTLNVTHTYDPKQRRMDFCEDCKNSFIDWFNKTEEKKNV